MATKALKAARAFFSAGGGRIGLRNGRNGRRVFRNGNGNGGRRMAAGRAAAATY